MNIELLIYVLTFTSMLLFLLGIDIGRGEKSKILNNDIENITFKKIAKNLSPVVENVMPDNKIEGINNTLLYAGYPYGLDTSIYIGIKILFAIGGLALGLLLALIGLPIIFIFIFAMVAFFIPTLIIRGKMQKRQNDIANNISNMVGLISIAINAGVELTLAFEAVSNNMPGVLGEIFRQAIKEINTGKKRSDVLRKMSRDTGVNTLERFIETINTAEERGGISLSEALNEFNYTLKEMESKTLQEKAKKLPTKMQLPLFLCIFGPMLIIMLTPVVFILMESL